MSSATQRARRIANLRSRITGPQDAYERCRAYPCSNRTTADRGEGLNRLYCRKHVEFHGRHGSYVKRSYGAAELRPYRDQAELWLEERLSDVAVQRGISRVERLLRSAGPPIEAFRLAGKKPAERARAMWAQLRVRGVRPHQILAAWLAVDLRLNSDLQPDLRKEYRHVQVGKLIHRMAGGSHRRWERERPDGRIEVTELHKHPASRGRVLRIVGGQLAEACEGLSAA
jgi:hypothetical protein